MDIVNELNQENFNKPGIDKALQELSVNANGGSKGANRKLSSEEFVDEKIPETIKEIFDISNRNRKKNKQRKKDIEIDTPTAK